MIASPFLVEILSSLDLLMLLVEPRAVLNIRFTVRIFIELSCKL